MRGIPDVDASKLVFGIPNCVPRFLPALAGSDERYGWLYDPLNSPTSVGLKMCTNDPTTLWANELLGPLLEIRRQADASDRRWQELVGYGQAQAEKLGIKEEDVDRLIDEWRAEQRER